MLELEHGFRIVDVGVRLDPDQEAVTRRGRDITPERLERELHQAGVVRAIVAPGPRESGGYLRLNNAVARLSVDRPFMAFARLGGPRVPDSSTLGRVRNLAVKREPYHADPEDVEQYAYDDRFHGFLLDPAQDGLPESDVLEMLAEVGSPVLVRGGVRFPPHAVEEFVLDYEFPVVLSGFGGFPLNRELMGAAIELLSAHDELYLDTRFVRFRDPMERALREHPDRVLFASGAPDSHPDVAVMEILTLDVPEDAMRRAFSKNPGRVISGLAGSE
ncbi:amidohydrolase 2 [Halalkaliarchaeum desulfuricum]|uniref:Amidohydrolase 2 n=1 Tax=Halalkaliarchaeum desulfuricum TaxID=2055893 RepID=A0A343TNS5_9EURY|nr:amidohydrolase family protein [Halalkaliarchaeum desulfuricum]AUX10747.1 amidohydrolase 2 [Halalkaliarchaeum desulfuricum]